MTLDEFFAGHEDSRLIFEVLRRAIDEASRYMREHPEKAFAACVVLYRHAGQRSGALRKAAE